MDDGTKIYKHLTCPLCGGIVCPDADMRRGCDQCDLREKDCEPNCTCSPSKYIEALRKTLVNVRELEELRYKLMLIEKAVYANNLPLIPTHKIKYILKGGWKYVRERVL